GQGSAVCVNGYREALSLTEKIGDTQAAAILAFNLGHAYKNLDGIRDLALSEQWYRRSLDARAKEDRMGRAKCLAQLGSVARRRFGDAREANRSREVCLSHLATAERSYLGPSVCFLRMRFVNGMLFTTNLGISTATQAKSTLHCTISG